MLSGHCSLQCSTAAGFSVHNTRNRQLKRIYAPKVYIMRPRLLNPTSALLQESSIQQLAQNHVLVATVTTSVVGQLLKPITSALRGKGFNWRLVISSGGMPSVHAACVTAACTSIALERGLSDSLFGLSVVFAAIVMYDAQGVRRAVGKQAEVINTLVIGSYPDSGLMSEKQILPPNGQQVSGTGSISSSRRRNPVVMTAIGEQNNETAESSKLVERLSRSKRFFELAQKLPSVETGDVNLQDIGDTGGWQHIPLKESVGHTKLEVLVGACWGIFCTLLLSMTSNAAVAQAIHSLR